MVTITCLKCGREYLSGVWHVCPEVPASKPSKADNDAAVARMRSWAEHPAQNCQHGALGTCADCQRKYGPLP